MTLFFLLFSGVLEGVFPAPYRVSRWPLKLHAQFLQFVLTWQSELIRFYFIFLVLSVVFVSVCHHHRTYSRSQYR